MRRRRLLARVAAAVGLAGCMGGVPRDTTPTPPRATERTSTTTPVGTTERTPQTTDPTPRTDVTPHVGGSVHGRPARLGDDVGLVERSDTEWLHAFLDVRRKYEADVPPDEDPDVVALRRASREAGANLFVSLQWNFIGIFGEQEKRHLPRPGSDEETALIEYATALLAAIDEPVDLVGLGNEPIWETLDSDFTGRDSRLFSFTRTLKEHLVERYTVGDPRFILGAFNRLYSKYIREEYRQFYSQLFEFARTDDDIDGIDLHVHYDSIKEAETMLRIARTQYPEGTITATEFSPIWRYDKYTDERITTFEGGDRFVDRYGVPSETTVTEYFEAAKDDPLSHDEMADFMETMPWYNVNFVEDMYDLLDAYDVEVGTFGFLVENDVTHVEWTEEWKPFQINCLFQPALIDTSLPDRAPSVVVDVVGVGCCLDAAVGRHQRGLEEEVDVERYPLLRPVLVPHADTLQESERADADVELREEGVDVLDVVDVVPRHGVVEVGHLPGWTRVPLRELEVLDGRRSRRDVVVADEPLAGRRLVDGDVQVPVVAPHGRELGGGDDAVREFPARERQRPFGLRYRVVVEVQIDAVDVVVLADHLERLSIEVAEPLRSDVLVVSPVERSDEVRRLSVVAVTDEVVLRGAGEPDERRLVAPDVRRGGLPHRLVAHNDDVYRGTDGAEVPRRARTEFPLALGTGRRHPHRFLVVPARPEVPLQAHDQLAVPLGGHLPEGENVGVVLRTDATGEFVSDVDERPNPRRLTRVDEFESVQDSTGATVEVGAEDGRVGRRRRGARVRLGGGTVGGGRRRCPGRRGRSADGARTARRHVVVARAQDADTECCGDGGAGGGDELPSRWPAVGRTLVARVPPTVVGHAGPRRGVSPAPAADGNGRFPERNRPFSLRRVGPKFGVSAALYWRAIRVELQVWYLDIPLPLPAKARRISLRTGRSRADRRRSSLPTATTSRRRYTGQINVILMDPFR